MKNKPFSNFLAQLSNCWYVILLWTIKRMLCLVADINLTYEADKILVNAKTIYVANHYSQIDALTIITSLPFRVFPVMAFDVAEGFPLWQWLIRVLAKSIGCVFIYRDGRTNINSVKKILSLLQKGECIFITPEGDRSSNKALMKAYNGAAYAAIKTGANIAPIASYGYEDIYQNILNRRKTKLYVIFGGAIAPAQMKGNYDEITECLMRRIALMLPPHYRGNYN